MKKMMALVTLVTLSAGLASAQEMSLLGVASATPAPETGAVQVAGAPCEKGQLGECTGDPGGHDFWAKAAGKAGILVMGGAVLIMQVRNHDRPSKPLGMREREALRPIFGGIVDSVKVVWNARMLDEWRILGKTFQFGVDHTGMTLGDTIYIAYLEPTGDWERRTLDLMIHEMTHTFQAHDRGSLRGFAEHYIRAWWSAGRNYADNWMEKQARCVAGEQIDAAYSRYQASATTASR